jgi:hypothetical protein
MRRTAAALVIACSALLIPLNAHAVHEGCVVTGEVQGLDTQRTCQYVATTAAQNVYVGTPYEWRIWVLRYDQAGQPLDVTLASGVGPVAGPPPQVHPQIGETVNVTMSFGCTPPYCGTIGFLAAGLEQGHP